MLCFCYFQTNQSKIAYLQKLANQSMVTGAFVIEMVTVLLVKAGETFVFWRSKEPSNWKKKKKWNKDMATENFISTRFRYISKLFSGANKQDNR